MRHLVFLSFLAGVGACSSNSESDASVPDGATGPENTAVLCQDGKDNDGDSKIDCDDPDCSPLKYCGGDGGSDVLADDDARVADGTQSDGAVTLPGCPQGCAEGEVCLQQGSAFKCVTAGPSKSCGSSTYGDGLPAAGVLYVDGAHTGGSDGSESQPYKTITEALAAISGWTGPGDPPTTIAVAKGTYTGDLSISDAVTIACRCPEGAGAVTIEGKLTVNSTTSAEIEVIVDGCTIRPEAYSGSGSCSGSGLAPRGVSVTSLAGPVSLLLRHTVIEGFCVGLYYSVLRTSAPAPVCVSQSRLSNNVEGIRVTEATSSLSKAQTWDTGACDGVTQSVAVERSSVGDNVAGIIAAGGARELSLRGNIVANNRVAGSSDMAGIGVYLGNAVDAVVTANVIKDNGAQGLGIINLETVTNAKISITSNQLEANRIAGIQFERLQLSQPVKLDDNLIKGTLGTSGGEYGDGILVTVGEGSSYAIDVQNNTVEGSARHGIVLDGVGGTVDGNTIASSGEFGLVLQQSTATVGNNSFSDNLAGEEHSYIDPVVKYGGLPIPLP